MSDATNEEFVHGTKNPGPLDDKFTHTSVHDILESFKSIDAEHNRFRRSNFAVK